MQNNEDEQFEEKETADSAENYKMPGGVNAAHEDLAAEENDGGEDELMPPEEENAANEINVGAIVAVIFSLIIIVFIIVSMFSGKKKETKTDELDKVGTKYEYNLRETPQKPKAAKKDKEKEAEPPMTEEEADAILSGLPENLKLPEPTAQPEPQRAPVSSPGSRGGGNGSERPDTRNSNSLRKIEGLAGLSSSYSSQSSNNGKSMSANTSNQRLSKEEYIAQMMNQTKALQNSVYGSSGGFGSSGSNSNTSNGSANFQQNRESFFNNGQSSGTAGQGEYLSYNSIWDGTIISGALVTGINTDNPGVVIARVTENVYSSYDHSFLLIPEGSLLYATYNSSVSYGQDKVQVAWNLLIRPDGYRVTLGNMNGVDAQGYSGVKGNVNNHPFATLKALGMVAVYSMIQTEMASEISSSSNEYVQDALSDMYTEAAKIGDKIIDKALDIQPTIAIKPGTEIKLITNTPLELPPVQVEQATRKYVRTR